MTIRSKLQARLSAWQQAQSPVPVVIFENLGTNPPEVSQGYLRAVRMPATRAGSALCSTEEIGILQVSIYRPADEGPAKAEAIAESLCTHFKVGSYDGFRVQIPPYYSQGMNTDDRRWMVPVSINYRAEA